MSDDTVSTLLGLSDVPALDTRDLGLKVSFRPLAPALQGSCVSRLLSRLEALLQEHGASLVPWERALETDSTGEMFLRGDVSAIFEGYTSPRSLNDHLERRIRNARDVQIVSVMELDSRLVDPATPYTQKLRIAASELVDHLAPIVIGASEDWISVINLNLCDTIVPASSLAELVERSLLPKLAAPIRPLPIEQFTRGWFRPDQDPWARQLREMAAALSETELFPPGWEVREFVERLPPSPTITSIVDMIAEGRTGVSYGFNALAAPTSAEGSLDKGASDWESLYPLPDCDPNELRVDARGRWFAMPHQGTTAFEVPDVWIYSSRSGALDKTNLGDASDLVRIGLAKGRMHFQIAEGYDFSDSIRPSYDARVMLAIALAAGIFQPELMRDGMPIVHFHGYPAPEWFEPDEHCTGQSNPEFSCGTPQAALLAFLEMEALCRVPRLRLGCIVEPGHGSMIVAQGVPHVANRLREGSGIGGATRKIELGGRLLQRLRQTPISLDSLSEVAS